ncbi:MAG TPA: DUF441 domain-containing protein [Thermoanaerobacterales bacterium]|nr:DUF441 domain-containing protein [Thermoanaerobacterales bacterium]
MRSYPLLFLILVLGFLSNNRLIYISAGVLMIFSLLGILPGSNASQNIILDTGVILLVIGVLLPLAAGNICARDVYRSIFTLEGLVSFLVGIASAVMARDGINLMKGFPGVMIGLLMGSIVGTAFFRGIPTGPLVAAGLAAFIINLIKKI